MQLPISSCWVAAVLPISMAHMLQQSTSAQLKPPAHRHQQQVACQSMMLIACQLVHLQRFICSFTQAWCPVMPNSMPMHANAKSRLLAGSSTSAAIKVCNAAMVHSVIMVLACAILLVWWQLAQPCICFEWESYSLQKCDTGSVQKLLVGRSKLRLCTIFGLDGTSKKFFQAAILYLWWRPAIIWNEFAADLTPFKVHCKNSWYVAVY